jgi:fermentation-respiration switch protein FrsA (DUF1100 family)
MKRWLRIAGAAAAIAAIAALVSLSVVTRRRAHELITNPVGTRNVPIRTPAAEGLPYDDVTVTTADGLRLAGWYVPSATGAVVIALHGYKGSRGEMLNEAAMLHAHGYGVLLSSFRAHDRSDGDLITFGLKEMQDMDAWFGWLTSRPDVDPGRVGMLGNSLGGTLAIAYAADHATVRAVVANSAFSSLDDTIETSIRFFTGLPPFPFAPMIVFWAEREAGFSADAVDAKRWIGRLSPRPILLMQGGKDSVISRESGQRLYDAAGEPRELWFDPDIRHTGFDTARAAEYERRVIAFFDRHLR